METDQYTIETTWSKRIREDIIIEAIQGEIPEEMERKILNSINSFNIAKNSEDKELFIKLFSLILSDKNAKPVQAIAPHLGNCHRPGSNDMDSFIWGWTLLKDCQDAGLYTLKREDDHVYLHPTKLLHKSIHKRLDKLQFLPPMKQCPLPWKDNHNGGWLWENKHLICGHRYNRHDRPLAYDVINKLQKVAWEIDPITYMIEKRKNKTMSKRQFLRVMKEYIGRPFYFVWRYDSRGRSYSSGYDINIQTDEYGKALVSHHHKELISKHKIGNLYIAIANHAGKDKLTWAERMDWASKQPNFDDIKWDEPLLGRKAVRALKDTQAGKPTGYPMTLDATSSGIQIMAILSGCKETAKFVNCIDPTKRYDLYNEVTELMNQQLTKPVTRKAIKEATMTHYYNSLATPKALLSKEQLEVFYNVLEGLLPGAESIMETINSCWQYTQNYHSWVMPDGHTVYKPIIEGTNGVYSDNDFGNLQLRWFHKTQSDDYRSLCPDVIHSIDGYVAREMIRRCDFQLTHIHDCFVFHPNYLQVICKTYREIMAEISKSDLLIDILRQITNEPQLTLTKLSDDLDINILNSEYMLS
jgi:hypothetical protein